METFPSIYPQKTEIIVTCKEDTEDLHARILRHRQSSRFPAKFVFPTRDALRAVARPIGATSKRVQNSSQFGSTVPHHPAL